MDKNTIIQAVIGLVTMVLIGCMGWLFTSISESKHNDDIQNVHLEYIRKSDNKQWDMFDVLTGKYIEQLLGENQRLKIENEKLKSK